MHFLYLTLFYKDVEYKKKTLMAPPPKKTINELLSFRSIVIFFHDINQKHKLKSYRIYICLENERSRMAKFSRQ